MQSQDDKHTAEETSFKSYRDPKFRGRRNPKVTNMFKNNAHNVNMRRIKKGTYSRYGSKLKCVPHIEFPASPRIRRATIHTDNSIASHSKFKKREITTIHEEMLLFKTKSHSTRKEKKDYKDKVASLKNVIKRLKEMGVAKTEKKQTKLPDVTQQFSGIQL